MIYFKKLDIFSDTREDLDLYHVFRKKYHSQENSDEPFMADNNWEEMMKQHYTYNGYRVFSYIIIDDVKGGIGSFSFLLYEKTSEAYKGNEKLVSFNIEILKQFRIQGLEDNALKLMFEESIKLNRSIFLAEEQNLSMKQYYNSIGASIVQTEIKNKLDLDKVDYSRLQKWVIEAKQLNESTKVITVEEVIPDEYRSEYAKTFNDVIQQMPLDDIDYKRKDFTVEDLRKIEEMDIASKVRSITVMSIERSGRISGLTIVKIISGSEIFVYQGVTGVLLEFRGRKLGKWVKAEMVLYLREKFPKTKAIITSNSNTNGPMLYINKKLGFKKYKELYSFQITSDELKKYLDSEKIISFELIS